MSTVKAGVDTWSLCWYLREGSSAHRAMTELATDVSKRGSMLVPNPIANHRVGWFPGARMLFAEGHPHDGGLCRADDLPRARAAIEEELTDRGIFPPAYRLRPHRALVRENGKVQEVGSRAIGGTGFGGIRRMDTTVDLQLERPSEGLAVLAGVAAVPVPRVKKQAVCEVGGNRIETVYFRGSAGKRVLGRWYDKGVESGRMERGLLIRPENQQRFPKASRLDVEAVASSTYVRDAFVRRFEPLWRASKGVKVARMDQLADKLKQMVEEDVITPNAACRIAGFLALESAGCNLQKRSTRYRYRREAADAGCVLADGSMEEVDVDLEVYIEEALDSGTWGCG